MKFIIVFTLFCCSLTVRATDDSIPSFPLDTLPFKSDTKFERFINRVTSSQAYQMTYVGVPLVVAGLIIKGEDDHFRSLRNDYLPKFRYHLDDYTQYLPMAVMVGMKVAGVESRSSWKRMLVSDVFTASTMAATVLLLKHTSQVTRPDGSNSHSFPSGHTATAFMAATMMSKEYGDRSPWYSIGAYSVATATGLMRMTNNKHWLSDVLVGAGIGILSTELGYYLADLIFKDKGLNDFGYTESFDRMARPTFFGIYLGFNLIPGTYLLSNGSRMSFSTGCNAGVEGAFFLNPYVGIGGRFSAGNMPVILDNVAEDKAVDLISTQAGAYFSYPLTSRLRIGSKILAGYSRFTKSELPTMTLGGKGGLSLGSGLSASFQAKQNMTIKFFTDYNLTPTPMQADKKCTQYITLGSAAAVTF